MNVFNWIQIHGNDNEFQPEEPEKPSEHFRGTEAKIAEMQQRIIEGKSACHSSERLIVNPKESNGKVRTERPRGKKE